MKTSIFWNNATFVRNNGNALCNWRYWMGVGFDFDKFTDHFMVPMDKYADLIICAKQCSKYCGFRKILRRRDGEFEAYCPENPADGFVIDQQEVLLYNIRESALVEEVARALSITPYMAKLANHEHSWKVGNIIVRGESHSVFFTLQWDNELLELILELTRLMHNPYVLLGASGHMYNNVVAGCLANGDAIFVPLDETLDLNNDAEFELMRPFSWEKLLLSPEALTEEPENIFRKCGDAWEVRFDGGEKFMLTTGNTGATYLHYMLARPNIATSVIEIMRDISGGSEDYISADHIDMRELEDGFSFRDAPLTGADNIADETAIRQYRKEIESLQKEISEAEGSGNNIMVEQLRKELETLTAAVYEAVAPDGQRKKLADQMKRLSDSFRSAVNFGIEKIAVHDTKLSEHLREHIHYGQNPGYFFPEDINWHL